jgi:hypothetical protein
MLRGTRRFVPCAKNKHALIAISFLCPQSEGGQLLSDATYAGERRTMPGQQKPGVKKLTQGIRVFACIANADGLRVIHGQGFAVEIANSSQAVAGSK